MTYSESIFDVITAIYDAATDPELWPDAIGRIASHLAADGGLFVGFSWKRNDVAVYKGVPSDPTLDDLYQHKYARNPWGDRAIHMPVGLGFTDSTIIAFDALERTEFYQELLRPRDIGHALFGCLAGNQDFLAGTNMHRSLRRGPFQQAELAKWQALLPHLRRAAQLQLRAEGWDLITSGALDALDHLSLGVAVMRADGHILFANQAAHAIAEARDGLGFDRKRIILSDSREDDRFRKLVASAYSLAAGEVSTGGGTMTVTRPSGKLPFQLLVAPIVGRAAERLSRATITLYIRDVDQKPEFEASWATTLYGLTPAEGRIAALVAAGLAPPKVAAMLGLSTSTVRTHLARVFDKTGARSQVMLARLLSEITAPKQGF